MKIKAGIIVLAVLLALGAASIGFATGDAEESAGAKFREACKGWWTELMEGLTPEEQEQAEKAHEEYRTRMNALHEEFRARKAEAREAFLSALPEEVREKMQEKMQGKMALREERRKQNMGEPRSKPMERMQCPDCWR